MAKIKFYKMVSAGNDFIVVDNRGKKVNQPARVARLVCRPHYGVGADGLLLAEHSRRADLKMRIFNPDGSEAEMCGNGTRCLALFARRVLRLGKRLSLETKGGDVTTEMVGANVRTAFAPPGDYRSQSTLEVNGKAYKFYFVNTGVPHVVIFVDKLEEFPVFEVGRAIRRHPHFAPHGTNANFVQVRSRHLIWVRTYERGVEEETLA